MKRFWHTWLAVVATVTIVGAANAQTDWNQSSEIGSYQSILSRAGYNRGSQDVVPSVPGEMANQAQSQEVTTGTVVNGAPTQGCGGGCNGGGAVYGNGAGCGGAVVNGGYMDNGGAMLSPQGGTVVGGGAVDGGVVYDGGYTGGYAGDCGGGGVYQQSGGMGGRLARAGGGGSNIVVGIRGLYLKRDHEDDVFLTRNATDILKSTDADMGTMGGIDFSMTKRNSDGNGVELRYWGLYPGQNDAEIAGPGLDTYLTGMSGVSVAPAATDLQTYYNGSDTNRIYRDNEFHNFEINLLKNGGSYTTRSGRNGTYELLGGFRWFQFNEDFRYAAFYAASDPTSVFYDVNVENSLLGFQLGGRSEICLSDRLSCAIGTKVGVYNNRISHEQNITDSNGNFGYRTAAGVDDYNFMSEKDDLAMIGELDLGMIYRLSSKSRLTWGYRAMGVSGIALAPSQIPSDFTLDNQINRINSNDSLILGGGYAGLEFCY